MSHLTQKAYQALFDTLPTVTPGDPATPVNTREHQVPILQGSLSPLRLPRSG